MISIEEVKKKYRMTADLHTHTTFSHGKGSIEDNVLEARGKGLKQIAISDHGPGHLFYGVERSRFAEMRAEIDRLNDVYTDIDIFLSVEANIVENGNFLDVTEEEKKIFDFIIAGYHYGVRRGRCVSNWLYAHSVPLVIGKSLLAKNTDNVVRAVYENELKILTHPGDKGPFDIDEIAKACEARGTLMEINMHHPHLSVEEIKTAAKYDVKFIISSDAHVPGNVGKYEEGVARAIEAGLDVSRIVNIAEIGEETL